MTATIRGRCWTTCILLLTVVTQAHGGGRACQKCGSKQEVKTVCRLVKVCQTVALPEYASLKRESFYPDQGAVCHTLYRCDTFYEVWREPPAGKAKSRHHATDGARQGHHPHPLPPLQTSSHTSCGCQTHLGAKSTGCHEKHCVRLPVGQQTLRLPVLKWETVHWCGDCHDRMRAKPHAK